MAVNFLFAAIFIFLLSQTQNKIAGTCLTTNPGIESTSVRVLIQISLYSIIAKNIKTNASILFNRSQYMLVDIFIKDILICIGYWNILLAKHYAITLYKSNL